MKTIRSMRVQTTGGVLLTVLDLPPGTWGAFPDAVSDQRKVEFYDTRYPHTIFGQHISAYYAETLLASDAVNHGLCLHGAVPEWNLSATTFSAIIGWLKAGEK